ncbi:MAG: beta-galactosidase [Phycisphaerae bacterium]
MRSDKNYRQSFGRSITPVSVVLLIFLLIGVGAARIQALGPQDEGMFPPTAVAKPYFNFDSRGFIIRGKRVFIASGSLHYQRVPRALWAARLLKMKRAGFNAVQTYVFWSYQEPRAGQFDFKGRHNLQAFLTLVKKMGFYAILRIGPYCNGEWSQGGLPVWLRFIPGMAVREDDKPFINAVNSYFNKLLPIVAANQINHGGPILMVQLENEDPQGWGDVLPNNYYKFLYHKSRTMGIDVPMYFSGMHHGNSPAGPGPWRSSGRTCPWFTTEMWTGWFTLYRTHPPALREICRQAMWHVIAYGGNGYDAYMAVGGTTPSYYVNNYCGPSYDFAAPIGQAGDLRPLYYIYKTANYFARSFQRILETSINVRHLAFKAPPGVRVFERKSPNGDIVFYQNLAFRPVTIHMAGGCAETVAGFHLFPIIKNFTINKTFTLRESCARIMGIFRQGATTTLVAYGPPASQIMLRIKETGTMAVPAKTFLTVPAAPGQLLLRVKVPAAGPDIYTVTAADKTLRIFVESRAAMYHTWFLHINGKPAVVCGPDYVGTATNMKGHIELHTQFPLQGQIHSAKIYFSHTSKPILATANIAVRTKAAVAAVPALGPWQVRLADAPAKPNYNDKSWIAAPDPAQMGVGDYPGLHQWYRANVTVARPGAYRILFSHLAATAEVFVNGKLVEAGGQKAVEVSLKAGANVLAIMVSSHGRRKLWTYIGPYQTVSAMGIWGKVLLMRLHTRQLVLKNWQYRLLHLPQATAIVRVLTNRNGTGWKNVNGDVLPQVKKTGMLWLRANLPPLNADHLVLSWRHALSNAFVCFNAGRVDLHAAGPQAAKAMLTFWYGKQPNILSILLPANATHKLGRVTVRISRLVPGISHGGAIMNWRMHGGMGSPFDRALWTRFTQPPNVPCFYRTTFNWDPQINPADQLHIILRVAWGDLTGGYMWLNGHNLGHYPDAVMRMGLYIPSCWLKSGINKLTISDAQGSSPRNTRLVVEQPASRWYALLVTHFLPAY